MELNLEESESTEIYLKFYFTAAVVKEIGGMKFMEAALANKLAIAEQGFKNSDVRSYIQS